MLRRVCRHVVGSNWNFFLPLGRAPDRAPLPSLAQRPPLITIATAIAAGFRWKELEIAPVLAETSWRRSLSSDHHFRQVRYGFSSTFRALADGWGVTPRVGVWAGGLEFFRLPDIDQTTHALPARVAGRGRMGGDHFQS
ncbi:unnamed protein product [Prunus armeniaca]